MSVLKPGSNIIEGDSLRNIIHQHSPDRANNPLLPSKIASSDGSIVLLSSLYHPSLYTVPYLQLYPPIAHLEHLRIELYPDCGFVVLCKAVACVSHEEGGLAHAYRYQGGYWDLPRGSSS